MSSSPMRDARARRSSLKTDAPESLPPCRGRGPDLREHPLVFADHDIPPVIAADVLAAVSAHGRAQLVVAQEELQAFDELVAIAVVEPCVALAAVVDEDLAPRVDENRRAGGQALERDDRQALERRGHDDHGSGLERL